MLLPLLETEESLGSTGSKVFLLDALISLVQFSTTLLSCSQQPGSDILTTEVLNPNASKFKCVQIVVWRPNTDTSHPVMVVSKWMLAQIQATKQRSSLIAPLASLMLEVAKYMQNSAFLNGKEVRFILQKQNQTMFAILGHH